MQSIPLHKSSHFLIATVPHALYLQHLPRVHFGHFDFGNILIELRLVLWLAFHANEDAILPAGAVRSSHACVATVEADAVAGHFSHLAEPLLAFLVAQWLLR